MNSLSINSPFIWETHGIHIGTGKDHVKHGIDNIDELIKRAVKLGFPALSFIIHTPRLTSFRYQSERDTDVKFIRGDSSYFTYSRKMKALKKKYKGLITIRYGIELEWMGSGLGLQWNRSKLFQAYGVDYVIGSVHFSSEGIPYDGSKAETESLIKLRGGITPFWAGYLDEMIEMIDTSRDMIHVVGHLDLPKLYASVPESMKDIDNSSHFLARRMRTLLEMVSDLNLALDLNLSGIRKGCGVYPDSVILKRACALRIPLTIGTDSHDLNDLGRDYKKGIELAGEAGYTFYVSFSRGIPEKRSINRQEERHFRILNLGIEMLKLRFERKRRQEIPKFSFGGIFRDLLDDFPDSVSLGEFHAIRVRRNERSITLSDRPWADSGSGLKTLNNGCPGIEKFTCLYSHHTDTPGTLSILFNTLASEGINVETAYLNSLSDGTATAFLTVCGVEKKIEDAIDFVMGTAENRFYAIEPGVKRKLTQVKEAPFYLLEVDGVDLPVPISRHMIITVHNNRPGVLLILLSALASRNVNVLDLQLGKRGNMGYAVLGIDGDERKTAAVLPHLGNQYMEATQIVFSSFDDL